MLLCANTGLAITSFTIFFQPTQNHYYCIIAPQIRSLNNQTNQSNNHHMTERIDVPNALLCVFDFGQYRYDQGLSISGNFQFSKKHHGSDCDAQPLEEVIGDTYSLEVKVTYTSWRLW